MRCSRKVPIIRIRVKSRAKRSATINGDIRLPGVFKDVVKANEDEVLEKDTRCAYFIVSTSGSLISGHLWNKQSENVRAGKKGANYLPR